MTKGITFSVHAPYYISMSSLEEDKRLNSVNYLLQSCALVKALGGRRVIFHAGSCGKQSREAALEKALDTMRRAVQAVDEAGYGDCILCPETMGKVNQLGTLDEVLALCSVDETHDSLRGFWPPVCPQPGTELNDETAPADYAAILDAIAAALPGERAKKFHAHPHCLHQGWGKMPPDFCGYRVWPAACPADAAAENPWPGAHHYL